MDHYILCDALVQRVEVVGVQDFVDALDDCLVAFRASRSSLHPRGVFRYSSVFLPLTRVPDRSSARASRPSKPRRMYFALIRNTIRLIPGARRILGAPPVG